MLASLQTPQKRGGLCFVGGVAGGTGRKSQQICAKQHCDLHRHFGLFSSFRSLENSRAHGEASFADGVLLLQLPPARRSRSARWRLDSRQDPRPRHGPSGGEVRSSRGLGDWGAAFPARSYHAAQCPTMQLSLLLSPFPPLEPQGYDTRWAIKGDSKKNRWVLGHGR